MIEATVDGIKSTISNPESWSERTLFDFQDALGIQTFAKGTSSTPVWSGGRAASQHGVTASLRKAGLAPAKADGSKVPDQRRRAIAVQIVNIVLRTLSEPDDNALAAAHAESSSSVSHSSSQDRRTRRGVSPGHDRKTSPRCLDANIIAKCGLIAFQTLDQLTPVDSSADNGTLPMLEKGLLAFAMKLVASKYAELAADTLRVVRARLVKYVASTKVQSQSCRGAADKRADKSSKLLLGASVIAGLLDFPSTSSTSATGSLLILEYYLIFLRLLLLLGPSAVPQSLPTTLSPTHQCAPCNAMKLLQDSGHASDKTRQIFDRVMQQLEQVATALAVKHGDTSKILAFQLLSAMSKNKLCAIRREASAQAVQIVWSTFTKMLTQAAKTSDGASKKFCTAAREAFAGIQDCVGELGIIESVPPHIYLHLGALTYDMGSHDEAFTWTERYVAAFSNDTLNLANVVAARIKLASICLMHDSNPVSAHFKTAQTSLSSTLSGTASDFNLLFTEMQTLVKAVTKTCIQKGAIKSSERATPECLEAYLEIFASMAQIYTKSLEVHTDPSRQKIILNNATTLMDAFLCLLKHFMTSERLPWDQCKRTADECVLLIDQLKQAHPSDCGDNDKTAQLWQKSRMNLSAFFWSFYNGTKEITRLDHRLEALRRSCSTLEPLTPVKRAAGGLPFKFHRLGRQLRQLGAHEETLEALNKCLRQSIELRCFDEIQTSVAGMSLSEVDKLSGPKIFFSALKTWIDAHLGSKTVNANSVVFDNTSLSEDIRGIVLEWQLQYLSSRVFQSALVDQVRLTITTACLTLYHEYEKPLRRQRLLVRYLRYSTLKQEHGTHKQLLDCAKRICESEKDGLLGQDSALAAYAKHFNAQLNICIGLHEMATAHIRFKNAMSTWQTLIQDGEANNCIVDHIGDVPSWLNDLHLLTEYYTMSRMYDVSISAATMYATAVNQIEDCPMKTKLYASACAATALMDAGFAEQGQKYLMTAQFEKLQGSNESVSEYPEYSLQLARNYLLLGDTAQWYVIDFNHSV